MCRDLAQNWNIDVAKDLEEYLEELEQISISFDGGRTTFNFAEAALVIQVSMCQSNGLRRGVVPLTPSSTSRVARICRALPWYTPGRLNISMHSSIRRWI